MDELISVIVPVYNVRQYLERCVDSIKRQTYKNLEIILVDDGSNDGSENLCDKLATTDSRIIVIHQENQGLGPARNAGLNIMKGTYVGFVDSDDWIDTKMYEELYLSLKKYHCDISTCGKTIVSDEGILDNVYCFGKEEIISNEEAIKHFLLQKDMNMSACDKLFNSNLFKNIRFPGDFLISEDIIPIYTVLKNANSVVLTKQPFYKYYYRLGSLSKSSFSTKTMGAYYYSIEVDKLISREYPYLKEMSQYFFYDQLIGIYRVARRSNYDGFEVKELYLKIKNELVFILKNSYLYKRQKIYAVLSILKLDKFLDLIYIYFKQLRQINMIKKNNKHRENGL